VPWLDRLAHDLRGPLAPLQTAVYLLKSGQLEPARQHELLELIERQTRCLGHMIEEMDDWSRASRGRLLGLREDCEASLLLDYARSGITPGDRMPPAITDDSATAVVHGDQVRLIQMLRILLEYAHARAADEASSLRMRACDGSLEVDLIDASPDADKQSIAMLLLEPMAEPFDEGLGLKLLIARAIAEAHGGSLVAERTAAGGVRLRCRLPLAPPDAAV